MQVRSDTTDQADFLLTKMDLNLYGDGDIDREDIAAINYLRGKAVTRCPACDMDDDGVITGLDTRKAVMQ